MADCTSTTLPVCPEGGGVEPPKPAGCAAYVPAMDAGALTRTAAALTPESTLAAAAMPRSATPGLPLMK